MMVSVSVENVGDYTKKMVSCGLDVTVTVKDGFMLHVFVSRWMRLVYEKTFTVIYKCTS